MEKRNFYEKYETEHQQVKEVVDNWDCSFISNTLSFVIESLSSCDIECDDSIGIDFNNCKDTLLSDIKLYNEKFRDYDKLGYNGYKKLLNIIDLLKKYNDRFNLTYDMKPKYPSAEKIQNDIDVLNQYYKKYSQWNKAISALYWSCIFIVNDIELIKTHIENDINNHDIENTYRIIPFFRRRIITIHLLPSFSGIYGYPVYFSDCLKKYLGYDDKDVSIIPKIINVQGMDVITYRVRHSNIESDDNASYIEYIHKSQEYLELLPPIVLESILELGTEIVYTDDLQYYDSRKSYSVAGVFYRNNKRIVLDASKHWMPDCILHEVGHAYDNYCGELFTNHDNAMGTDINNQLTWNYNDAIFLNSIDRSGYDENDYMSKKTEFFAESFAIYCKDKDVLSLSEHLVQNIDYMLDLPNTPGFYE